MAASHLRMIGNGVRFVSTSSAAVGVALYADVILSSASLWVLSSRAEALCVLVTCAQITAAYVIMGRMTVVYSHRMIFGFIPHVAPTTLRH